jgi:hypothetical protein
MAPLIWPTATTCLQPLEPFPVAFRFRQPAGHLEAEGDRFAMDGMGASDHHRALVLTGQRAEPIGKADRSL